MRRVPLSRSFVALLVLCLALQPVSAAFAHPPTPSCPQTVADVAREVLAQVRAHYGIAPDAAHTDTAKLTLREEAIAKAVAAANRQLGTLNEAAAQLTDPGPVFDACGTDGQCQKQVAVRFHHKVAALIAAVSTTLLGNGSAKARVREQIRQHAAAYVNGNLGKIQDFVRDVDTQDAGKLSAIVSDEAWKLAKESGSFVGFLKALVSPFASAIAAVTYRELRRPNADSPNGVNEARRDFLYSYGTVTLFQLAAHGLRMLYQWQSGVAVEFWEMLWVYGNTFVMMSLQAEAGARQQKPLPNNVQIRTMDDAVRALPGILHGERGYTKDSIAKFTAFIALLPYEVFSNVLMRSLNIMALGGVGAIDSAKLVKIVLQNLWGTAAFGIYLAARWSILDKWFYLNLLPAWRNGHRADIDAAVAGLREAGDFSPNLGELDIYRLVVPWWKHPFDSTLASMGGVGRAVWRTLTFRRYRSAEEQAEIAEAKAVFDRLNDTPQMQEFLKQYRAAIPARITEAAWRLSFGLFDSYLFFYLFGKKAEQPPEAAPAQ